MEQFLAAYYVQVVSMKSMLDIYFLIVCTMNVENAYLVASINNSHIQPLRLARSSILECQNIGNSSSCQRQLDILGLKIL